MSELNNDKLIERCQAVLDAAPIFYRTHWSQVKEGDTVLVPGDGEPIAEVTIKEIHPLRTDDGKNVITVYYRFGYATYGLPCDPNGIVYVQSRF